MADSKTEDRYIEAVGRRKASTARVRITPAGRSTVSVNGLPLDEYFDTDALQKLARSPLTLLEEAPKLQLTAQVKGGGITSQAESVRMGLARALVTLNDTFKKPLRDAGFLTRDARVKERRKFGLKKARKKAQWSKR